MDIRWLQDFLTVADTGNFTRAAQLRHSSQAAFSRRIQQLEAWLGTPLLDRESFPTRLTPDGELFRERAAEIVQKVTEARLSLTTADIGRRAQVRIALPHALATGRLPQWWSAWRSAGRQDAICAAMPGNVHDTVTALVTGSADVLICFHTAQQPIHLAPDQYERVVIDREGFKPYVSAATAKQIRRVFPGSKAAPLSLLMYSPGAYLARVVALMNESAPRRLIGRVAFESDMATVLRNMAAGGHGVAWLPDSVAAEAPAAALEPIEHGDWCTTLSIVAYRDRQPHSAAVDRLWATIVGKRR